MIVEISGIVASGDTDSASDKFSVACLRDMSTQLRDANLYLNHKRKYASPVGKTVAAQLTKVGLVVNFVFDDESPKFLQAVAAISRGVLTGFSVAYIVKDCRTTAKGIRIIERVKLKEISLAKKGVNGRCLFIDESLKRLRKKETKLLGRL